jgi:hypothetical protein
MCLNWQICRGYVGFLTDFATKIVSVNNVVNSDFHSLSLDPLEETCESRNMPNKNVSEGRI